MSKFTSWFTPFLTKTAKIEPVNAGMRAMGMNKLADSRQHFETVEAPRAANQFVGAVSKPVTGLEKHYGPYHNDSGTAKTRNDASNHGGDIGAIVAALYFGGSAAAGAAGGGGGGAGAAVGGTEAGTAGAAGGTAGTAAMGTTEALYGTAGYGSGAGFAADGSVMAGEGAAAGGAAGGTAAGTEAAATSAETAAATPEASTAAEASTPESASQAPAAQPSEPAPQAAQGDMDSYESNNPDTSTPYSNDQGGMEQYESDSGNEPNGAGSNWQEQARKYGKLMQQSGKGMQKPKPEVDPSRVDTSTGVLKNPYVTSSRTKKTGPTAPMRQLVSAQSAQRDPIDANGLEMGSIHALSKQIQKAKQKLASIEGKTK